MTETRTTKLSSAEAGISRDIYVGNMVAGVMATQAAGIFITSHGINYMELAVHCHTRGLIWNTCAICLKSKTQFFSCFLEMIQLTKDEIILSVYKDHFVITQQRLWWMAVDSLGWDWQNVLEVRDILTAHFVVTVVVSFNWIQDYTQKECDIFCMKPTK